jgi:hypothetical protein
VPEPIVAGAVKAGKLVRVLEPFAPMAPGVFLYYPGYPANDAEAACLHRLREEPLGNCQQDPNSH